jgi:hypothetical protein
VFNRDRDREIEYLHLDLGTSSEVRADLEYYTSHCRSLVLSKLSRLLVLVLSSSRPLRFSSSSRLLVFSSSRSLILSHSRFPWPVHLSSLKKGRDQLSNRT